MRMIIINEGSSSIKYTTVNGNEREKVEYRNLKNEKRYDTAIKKIIKDMHDKDIKIAIHRIVHGYGQKKTAYYNKNIRDKIISARKIAPLHSKYEIMTLDKLSKENIKQICVFDSLPYDNLQEFSIPKKIIKKHNLHRFGFHGLSHLSMRESCKDKKIITVHLGSGSSVTGWTDNNTLFHSMGFSPNEGMIMMTRSGSIDNGIILYLLREGYTANQIDNILEHESGMKAICNNNDFKTIISRMKKGNDYEKAYNTFVNNAAENILRATVYTGKPEQIIFAGSIGENSKKTVNDIMKKILIKTKYSSFKTDEEKIMIREALQLINHKS